MTNSVFRLGDEGMFARWLLRTLLGCMFLWSGLLKLRQPYALLDAVAGYGLVGESSSRFIAATLPCVELIVGICLTAGVFVGAAFLVGMMLSAVFITAQAIALWRGLVTDCGCFGSFGTTIGARSFSLAGTLFVVSCIGFCLSICSPRSNTATRQQPA